MSASALRAGARPALWIGRTSCFPEANVRRKERTAILPGEEPLWPSDDQNIDPPLGQSPCQLSSVSAPGPAVTSWRRKETSSVLETGRQEAGGGRPGPAGPPAPSRAPSSPALSLLQPSRDLEDALCTILLGYPTDKCRGDSSQLRRGGSSVTARTPTS